MTKRRDTPEQVYTEKALAAAKRTIPRIVYLPRRLRAHGQKIDTSGLVVRVTGPEIADNHLRIQEADPLGWMIARMNGQPIPTFEVICGAPDCGRPLAEHTPAPHPNTRRSYLKNPSCGDPSHAAYEATVRVNYYCPTPKDMESAAQWLGNRVTYPMSDRRPASQSKSPHHDGDFEALVANAIAGRPTPDLEITDAIVPVGEDATIGIDPADPTNFYPLPDETDD